MQKQYTGLHEQSDDHQENLLPSERKFGLTVGGISLAIGCFRWITLHLETPVTFLCVGVGAVLIALALLAPSKLRLANLLWAKLGLLLARIVNPVVMFAIFLVVFVPAALIMRLRGRDVLNLRGGGAAPSTWVNRVPPGPDPQGAINQF